MPKVRVTASTALVEGEPLSINVGGQPVMVVRWEGRPYAIGDVCTHQYALLSEGFFENGCIECPLHQASFDVRTGAALCGPVTTPARSFAVSEENGEVFVELQTEGAST